MGEKNYRSSHSITRLFTASDAQASNIRHSLSPGSSKYCGYNLRAHSGQTL